MSILLGSQVLPNVALIDRHYSRRVCRPTLDGGAHGDAKAERDIVGREYEHALAHRDILSHACEMRLQHMVAV